MPSEKEISDIVEVILLQSRNPIFLDSSILNTTSGKEKSNFEEIETLAKLSVELEKFTVVNFNLNSEDSIPSPPQSINFITLIEFNYPDSSKYFTLADTTYIQYQNDNSQNFAYLGNYLNQLNITEPIRSNEITEPQYGLSVPIFSNDKKTAYVEVTYHCNGLCSEAFGYILVKENNAWKIAKKKLIWIS